MSDRFKDENGRIAVLYSPGYGAGWSTWNDDEKREFLLFDPTLVKMCINKESPDDYLEQKFPGEYVSTHGWDQIKIAWLDPGTQFQIKEYDGSESITTAIDLGCVA